MCINCWEISGEAKPLGTCPNRWATANKINESVFKTLHEQSPSRNADYLEKEPEKLVKEKAKMRETIKLLNGSNERLVERNISLAEENEKLKAENAEPKASNSTILDRYFHRNGQYVELHKENQRILDMQEDYEKRIFQKDNLIKSALELKNKYMEENKVLKENNKYLCDRMNEYNCKINNYDEIVKENEQLKAHLQTCDKTLRFDSQTERKPHVCPKCDGATKTIRWTLDTLGHRKIEDNCMLCKGTGIVWEN